MFSERSVSWTLEPAEWFNSSKSVHVELPAIQVHAMSNLQQAFNAGPEGDTARRVDSAAWAIFFVSVGIATLIDVP